MKYKLPENLNAITITVNEKTYSLTHEPREFPDIIVSMFGDVLIGDEIPKKGKTAPTDPPADPIINTEINTEETNNG